MAGSCTKVSDGTDCGPVNSAGSTGPIITKNARVPQLDSIRGIAAIIVMLGHFLLVFPFKQNNIPLSIRQLALKSTAERLYDILHIPPLGWLSSGHSAVILFFVLSGFSLHRMLAANSAPPTFVAYLKRRTARIYLPYLVALALAIMLDAGLSRGPIQGVSHWFNLTWQLPLRSSTVVSHVLFIGKYDYSAFNTAFWSLAQEMRISIVFPALFWISTRRSKAWIMLITAACLTIGTALARKLQANIGDPAATPLYAGVFLVGLLVSENSAKICRSLSEVSTKLRAVLTFICLFLLFNTAALLTRIFHVQPDFLQESFIALGAAGIIASAMASRSAALLLQKPTFTWLGKISYSIYLVHGSILFALVRVMATTTGIAATLIPYFVITLVTANFFHRVFEAPSIRLSRRTSQTEAFASI